MARYDHLPLWHAALKTAVAIKRAQTNFFFLTFPFREFPIMLRRIFPLALLAATLPALAVQTCPANNVLSTPTIDFTDNGDGTVTHSKTGLTWQRCLVGQTWSGSTCTGSASAMNWSAALQAGAGSSLAGQSDWRLPNIKELRSIVESGCYSPAINSTLFPNDPGGWTWSSTSYATSPDFAWLVGFYVGYANSVYEPYSGYARLVRSGQLLGDFDMQGSSQPWLSALFARQAGVTPSTVVTSSPITLTGLTTSTGISVSGGSYSVNGVAYTTTPGAVKNGDVITLQHMASADSLTRVSIGGTDLDFRSTTDPADTSPDPFDLISKNNADISVRYESSYAQIKGVNTSVLVSVSSGCQWTSSTGVGYTYGEYGPWTQSAKTVEYGQSMKMRCYAPALPGQVSVGGLTVGDFTAYFAIRTSGLDTTPPVFVNKEVAALTESTATLAVISDEDATGYWLVLPANAASPSLAQVKAGQDASNVPVVLSGNGALSTVTRKTFNLGVLAPSTAYKVYFAASDPAGNDTAVQVLSFSTTADMTAPILSAVGVSSTSSSGATLSITSAETATGYWVVLPSAAGAPSVTQVKAGQDGSSAAASFAGNAAMVAATAKSFTVSGLTASTAYKLYFVARDTAGNDTTVQTVSFSTSAAVTVPGAPTSVSASAGNGQATVSFTAPASNGGSAILGYTVVSNPAGGVDAQADGTATTHTVTGLTNGTPYTFTVTARNTAGSSSASSASSGVTPSAPVVYVPPADPAPAPTPAPTEINVGGGALTISGGLPVRIGSDSVGAALTMNSAAPVTFTLNGSDISVQASVGSVLTVKQISVGGKDVLVLALTQGSVSLTATQAGQALLALGDMLLQAGSAGTVISAGSGQVAVSSGSLILAGNAFAALKDGTLYAGEVAKLNAAGKISSIRLGSADGSGTLAGDALALSGQATGLTLQAVITRLGGKVGRLPDGLEKAVATALGGSGAQNAGGTLVVAGSPPRHLLPLGDITVDTDVADGASITADGLTRAAKNGVVVTLAPAPRDLNQFAKDLAQAVPGATLTLRDGGVLVLRLSGSDYVVRLAAEVGSSNAVAGDQAAFASSEGVLRYRDGQGGQQALYPAFLNYPATLSLLESLSSGVGAAANADGSISVKLGADRFTLIPDLALAPLGTKNITHVLGGQKWWLGEDGRVYLNGSGGVQGVEIK